VGRVIPDRNPPQFRVEKPLFRGAQNAVIRCSVEECGWNACGPRDDLGKAWNEHYRMHHSQEVGVVQVDKQFRDRIWTPTAR
jgi:hypothetical protein